MNTRGKLLVAVCGIVLGAAPVAGVAQVIEPLVPVPPLPTGPTAPPEPGEPSVVGKTVTDRARPELDPLGLRLGEFFLFPRAEIDEGYNSNIFATPSPTVGAWSTALVPSFDLQSNFPQNAIDLSGGAAIGRYFDHSSEDFDDGYGAVNSRLDINSLDHFYAGARFDHLHEPRTSPNSPGNAAEPVRYWVYTGNVGIAQTGTRFGYEADGIATRSEYEAPPAVGGGVVPQSDRNVTGLEGALRFSYELQPDYQAFVRVSGNDQIYDHAAGNGIPIRSSTGYRADVGARLDLTGVTYAELYIGYLAQNYAAAQFGSISGLDYGATIVWNVSTLDTVKLGSVRTVNNASAEVTSIAASPGYLGTVSTASLDHELLRNVLLNVNASYEIDDWENIDRTDHIYGFGSGVKYLVNRNLYVGVTYNFNRRLSSGAEQTTPYAQSIVLLRLGVQL